MKKIIFLLLACFFVTFSCKSTSSDLEMTTDQLAAILCDVHLIEGALLSVRPSQKDSLKTKYYEQVFEIHQVEKVVFEREMEIVKANPKLMESIYTKVVDKLEKQNKTNKKDKKK